MAQKKTDDKPVVGKAPEGQIIAETPATSAPVAQHHYWGIYGYWLGDAERRYGRLTSARAIPIKVKLEMLRDPIIGMAMGFITATLAKATRVIECADGQKRRFFEVMFRAWEQEFIDQAALAVALGSVGLIKRFAFQVPKPKDQSAAPVWTSTTAPFIVRGFDLCYPVDCTPRFDTRRRHFEGISTPDGNIDVFYSLWITRGKARAFGAYEGSGRLEDAYNDWWYKYFGRDLYMVHLQKERNPAVVAKYPPGTTKGTSHRDIALATGDSVRSGATVALSSLPYKTVDTMGSETFTNAQRWDLSFLRTEGDSGSFHATDDHHDAKMSIAMMLPPQVYMNVKQSALGGPTTAEVLTDLAEDLLLLDAKTIIDDPLNLYVFPAVDRANFPSGSPPVTIRTTELSQESRARLLEIMKSMVSRADTSPPVDVREGLRRLGIPVLSVPEPTEDQEPPAEHTPASADGSDPVDNPPERVLRKMIEQPVLPITPADTQISQMDISRTMRRLRAVLPELFDEPTEPEDREAGD
jgi:hypothetical protein